MGWCCSLEIFVIWIELWISGFGVFWFSFICGELSHNPFLLLLFFCFEVLNLGLGVFFFTWWSYLFICYGLIFIV